MRRWLLLPLNMPVPEQSEARQLEHRNFLGLDKEALRSAHALEVALECMPVGVSWATVAGREIVFTNR